MNITDEMHIRSKLQTAFDELSEHEATYGDEPADPGQAERRSRLLRQIDNLGNELEAAEAQTVERAAKLDAIKNAAYKEPAFAAPVATRTTPWRDSIRSLSEDQATSVAETVLERGGYANADALAEAAEHEPHAAGMIVARSNPAYESAFGKILRNPERALLTLTESERAALEDVEHARASLSTNVNSGGYLIPLSLDPSAVIANAGTANPFRKISRVVQAASSPHRIATTTGASSQWLAENTAASDATPTFGKVDIDLHKQLHWITASYEILQDGALLAQNIGQVAADARDQIESSAFAIGSGSGAPYGVVTAVAAVTASRVTPTTGGVFTTASVLDVYKTFDTLPARARQSSQVAWVANNAAYSIIRQMSPSANGGSFWTDLGGAMPPALLGVPRYESSVMDSTMTTGSEVLVIGDFSKYVIVDHIAGPSVEYVANVVDGSGLPTGTRGWLYWHRVGANVADAGAFRVLQL